MKRIFICSVLALLFVVSTYYGLLEYGQNVTLFECEAGTFDHETEVFYTNDEGAILCNLAQLERNEYNSQYDTDQYQSTIFGGVSRMLIVFVVPALLGLFIGILLT